MRTLIVFLMMCGLSYGQSIMKDGKVMETLPQKFFSGWEAKKASSSSFIYRVESHDDVHRIFKGDFKEGDEPLPKMTSSNPKDRKELIWFIPIQKHKRVAILLIYFHKVPDSMKFDLVRMYIAWDDRAEMRMVPPQIFPNPGGSIDDFAIYMMNNVGEWLTVTKGQIQ